MSPKKKFFLDRRFPAVYNAKHKGVPGNTPGAQKGPLTMKEGNHRRNAVPYNAEAERAENTVGARIQQARKDRGWSLVQMAEQLKPYGIDLGKTALSKWENGDSLPNVYQFLAVCRALGMDDRLSSYCADYQPELNEEGRRLVAQYRRDLVCSGNYRPAPKTAALIRFREVPVAYIPAAAGTGNFLDDADLFEKVSFPEDSVPKGADLGIRISGDSMEPVYHDGQIVFVQKCSALNPGEVGIFDYDGKAYIKQYGEQEPDGRYRDEFTDSYGTLHPQPVLISYNAEYDPIEVSPYSAFRVFGKVLR